MKKIIKTLLLAYCLFFLNSSLILSQQENVPIDHPVYIFLKEMSVKNILADIHDDNPLMSRAEVKNYLDEINSKLNDLSATEKNILKKFKFNINYIIICYN